MKGNFHAIRKIDNTAAKYMELTKILSGYGNCQSLWCHFYNEKRDVEKLKQALNLVIERQAGFRLRFQEEEEVRQYVAEYEEIDIPAMTFETETEFDKFANCFAKEPFGLTNCVLYRFVVFELDGKSGVLVLLSHLISDAWTFSILARKIDHAYGKLQGKEDTDLLQADYMDYVEAKQKYFASAKYDFYNAPYNYFGENDGNGIVKEDVIRAYGNIPLSKTSLF